MTQDILSNFDYVFDSDWGQMIYKIMKDDAIKILLWESKEKYELCAKQMKETLHKINAYSQYHEHYHLSYTELELLFQNTFATLIQYNREHYTTFE